MPKRACASLTVMAATCVLCGALPSARAAGSGPPLTTAELLVDLARDYGLSQQGRQTAADVKHVRALLQAAVRLEPKQAEAYVWLYELALLDGDDAEAGRMLTALVSADPENQTAFSLWLAAGLRAQQTVEKRIQWLEAVLASQRPARLHAMVRVELARLALEQLDFSSARRHLAAALELEPASVDAALLAVQALSADAPPAERLRAILRLLRATPLTLEPAWQAALILDAHGFFPEAARFFAYAREIAIQLDPRGVPPGALLLDGAHNQLALGQLDEAIESVRQAVALEPAIAAQAGMFLRYLLERAGRQAEADTVLAQLTRRFAALTDPREHPVNEVAQAAWFYCTLKPDAPRAVLLARAAVAQAPDDPFTQRTLGWALALDLKTDEAHRVLRPIAARDPYAAGLLAKLLRAAGDADGARRVIDELAPKPTVGPAADLLAELTEPSATAPASQPSVTTLVSVSKQPELAAVLAEFDDAVLQFRATPTACLQTSVQLERRGIPPGEPWWAIFSLTNRASFPITLGPRAMANPVFLVSFSMEGDRQREFPALLTVSIDQTHVLYPGETVQVRRTLDVGPVRRHSRQTPQQPQRVILRIMRDAERGPDGEWRVGATGTALEPIYFNRLPVGSGPEAISALFNALTGENEMARVRAIEVAAELLGEHQRAQLKRLNYRPAPVPADRLRGALLDALASDSWELRVRTLEALHMVGLDRRMADAVEQCLDHPHWLVRMMAVRVLARQGPNFADKAANIARHDDDELVKALAESYCAKWQEHGAGTERKSDPESDR